MDQVNIDVHWHHVPASFVAAVTSGTCPVAGRLETVDGEPVLALDGGFRQDFPASLTSAEQAIAAMDSAGLDVVAASVAPPLMHYNAALDVALTVSRTINDGLADLAQRHPERFRPLANVPLQDPQAAAAELRRAMTELGLAGVQIDTNVNGRNLGDAELRPFWRAVAELDAFVFLHPGPVCAIGADGRLRRHNLVNFVGLPVDSAAAVASLIFDGVYEELGPLKTCFAHGGGAFPYILSRWDHGYGARHAPRDAKVASPSSYLPSIYCDSLTHSDMALAFLVDVVGADHVLLGSDYPFDMGNPQPVRSMERAIKDTAARAAIGGGTAARLLGI